MLVVGTFQGDIRIYELEIDSSFEGLSEKQKLELRREPKLIEGGAFNFFNKNARKEESNFPIKRKVSSMLGGRLNIKRGSEFASPNNSGF